MRQVYNSQREQRLQIALIDRKLTDLTSGGATPHPYGGAMGTGMPSLNSGAVSGGATPQYTATGTPSYGGATGTGMPSLNSRAVSGGATPQYTATGTPSYGGATGTGMPSLNSRTGGAMPSSVKALNMTEHFMSHISPRKRQTAEEVMHTFSRYKNRRDIGRLAIVLAKYTYFGHNLMACSTTTGCKGTKALDTSRLQQIRANIHSIFPLLDDEDFSEIWANCLEALRNACKRMRSSLERPLSRKVWLGRQQS